MEEAAFSGDSSEDDLSNGSTISLSTDETEISLNSDYEEYQLFSKNKHEQKSDGNAYNEPTNLIQKLLNRESAGSSYNRQLPRQQPRRILNKVPNRLRFCIKDFVPHCFLQGHIFMGLSSCGQFLFSYKVSCSENLLASSFNFNNCYKYSLYFWIYQPHKPLRNFYKCCLFDDHGVDSIKKVTMVQWKCVEPNVLIVHGAAEDAHEDSYLTYVKVPKLGCADCKKLRDITEEDSLFWQALCLKCNLTVHTKYSSSPSDQKFNPYVNLICPGSILIVANGFLHMLRIDLDIPNPVQYPPSSSLILNGIPISSIVTSSTKSQDSFSSNSDRRTAQLSSQEEVMACDNHNNIVARIIADFSDIETDSLPSTGSSTRGNDSQRNVTLPNNENIHNFTGLQRKTYDELIFTCSASSPTRGSPASSVIAQGNNVGNSSSSSSNASVPTTKVGLLEHRGQKRHRIVTKSFRNGVTTVDLQTSPVASTSTAIDKSNAYEFSEDNEKCEKIATLRKRRLADKKYEFSEDNSENIVPFTKMRSAGISARTKPTYNNSSPNTSPSTRGGYHRSPAYSAGYLYKSPCASPCSSPHPSQTSSPTCETRHCTPPPVPQNHTSLLGTQLGFRSPPCNSPVSSGLTSVMRSPTRQIYGERAASSSIRSLSALSTLQVPLSKRNQMEMNDAMSPNSTVPFLSPLRDEIRNVEVPLQGNWLTEKEKPICTKKFKRRYVEEDDAASVITSEEDDCISPGYHTSLPVEVHGSCYSAMQMISQTSYQQLHCASVVITQHSLDFEALTYHLISNICQKNQKTYDVFFDWACELINVCPQSCTISCILLAQFTARDQAPATPNNCINCLRKLDCAFHRRKYECQILFNWNMETGDWEVLDYGELKDAKILSLAKQMNYFLPSLDVRAREIAHELFLKLNKIHFYSINLRVLRSKTKRSKRYITDLDNMVEFHLRRLENDE